MSRRVDILGVPVDDVTQDEAVAAILALVGKGKHQVVTINPEFVVQSRSDTAFRNVLRNASLALPDGVGLLLGARLTNQKLRGRATGVETLMGLARASAEEGSPSLFLLGGGAGVGKAAGRALEARYPGCKIAGVYDGSPADADFEQILDRVNDSSPDILAVAYGAPRQDLWIASHLEELDCSVAMGVGGALDYLSGKLPRAPRWMRQAGLEWSFRLARQPWRARRMTRLPRFVWLSLRARGRADRAR